MIKIAVIGEDYQANIIESLSLVDDFEITAYLNTKPSVNTENSKITSYQDYNLLLSLVDALYINIPTEEYYKYATEAIKLGKHVFLSETTPFNSKKIETLIKLAIEAKVVVQSGHSARFSPLFLHLKTEINNPLFIEVHRSFDQIISEKFFFDAVLKDVDIVLKKINNPIKKIAAHGFLSADKNIEMLNARIEFSNTAIAHLVFHKISKTASHQYNFFQKNKNIHLDLTKKTYTIDAKNEKEIHQITNKIDTEYNINTEFSIFASSIKLQKLIPVLLEETLSNYATTHTIFDLIKNKF